jgi:hypothetical protein
MFHSVVFFIFSFQPKKLITQERGWVVVIINEGETNKKVQRAKKAKKRGRCKRTQQENRVVTKKKREKTN